MGAPSPAVFSRGNHTHTPGLRSSIFELATSPGAELRYLKVGIS